MSLLTPCQCVFRRPISTLLRQPIKVRRMYRSSAQPEMVNTQKWQLFSALLLERLPVISPELSKLETEFIQLTNQREIENSYLSDHEMQLLEEERLKEASKTKGTMEKPIVTLLDTELAWKKQLNSFKRASRETEADKTADKTSLERRLDTKLALLVRQNFGSFTSPLTLPRLPIEEGETLRETADRILEHLFGSDSRINILGNAPVAFHKYRYPIEAQKEYYGGKFFIFKAHVRPGTIELAINDRTLIVDYLWLTHREMKSNLRKDYYKKLKPLLYN